MYLSYRNDLCADKAREDEFYLFGAINHPPQPRMLSDTMPDSNLVGFELATFVSLFTTPAKLHHNMSDDHDDDSDCSPVASSSIFGVFP